VDQFREIEVFIQIGDLGSISAAAEALDLSISATSRHLVSLESRLGVQLVQRTTRRLSLTEAGAEFHRRCKGVIADMREAEETVTETTVKPTGILRVTASLSFCLLHIAPLLPEFTARYPDITIDVIAANRYYDIIENGVDVAIRTRTHEADSNITIRRLAETRRVLAASRGYLARHGKPASPQELTSHKILNYALASNPNELPFRKDDKNVVVRVKPLLDANDGQILRQAAIDGMGILVQPKYIVYDDLTAGRLVSVLDEWDLPRLTMNIAFQTRAHMPAKARLFIDALVERFEVHDFERLWTA
jgi:DNA-binding transcriptional LysR family regulator